MKYRLAIVMIISLILTCPILADGIILPPPTVHTYEFHAIQEKQQYAVIEVLSNYFERINMFLSLSSLDFKPRNVTLIIPLKSIPTEVDANKISSKEFLEKYEFKEIEKQAKKQSLVTFIKNSSSITAEYLKNYMLSSLFTPLYFAIPKGGYFAPRAMLEVGTPKAGARYLPEGVEYIKKFEFEGGYMEIYKVESGASLGEFIKQYKGLEMPENLKKAVDNYKAYYIALLNLEIKPIEKYNLLKKYAPNTLRELIDYIKANPDLSFECVEPRYWYSEYPYYKCDERRVIKEKFAEFIEKAKKEAENKHFKNKSITIRFRLDSSDPHWASKSISEYEGSTEFSEYWIQNAYPHGGTTTIIMHIGNITKIETPYLNFRFEGGGWWKVVISASSDGRSWNNLYYRCAWITGECPGDNAGMKSLKLPDKYKQNLWLKFSFGDGNGRYEYIKFYKDVSITSFPLFESEEESFIETAIIDFILSAYSNSTKGTEMTIELPIKGEVYYPLGTGIAWQNPIEDTKVLVKMDENLEAEFENKQEEVLYNGKRYYLWSFKNWNPDYDIVGKINRKGFLTSLSDSEKKIVIAMNANITYFAIAFFVLAIGIAILAVIIIEQKYFKEKRKKGYKDLALPTLFAGFSPLVSLWLTAFLPIILKTDFKKKELKAYARKIFILFATLLVLYIILTIIKIIL